MSDRRITVVIMTRNRRDELLETLARMTALPERVPVIVADNASTDGTCEALAERFGQVRLLCCQRNFGAVARNLAVREVTTLGRPPLRRLSTVCSRHGGALRRSPRGCRMGGGDGRDRVAEGRPQEGRAALQAVREGR
jgi:hypothetical protein